MPVQIITNVARSRVSLLSRMYRRSGAMSVTEAPERDGEVTLIIVWDDHEQLHATILSGIATGDDEDDPR